MPSHGRIRAQQRPRPREQVGEVERAGRPLQVLVAVGGAGELLLERRRQVGVGPPAKVLQVGEQGIARREDGRPRDVRAVFVAAAFARTRQAAIAHEVDQTRFPSIEIHLAERLFEQNLAAEAAHGVRVDEERVAAGRGPGRQVGEGVQRCEQALDFGPAVERRPPPRLREVAPLGQHPAGAAQSFDRPAAIATLERGRARPSQRAAQALGRALQRLLQPRTKRPPVQTVRLRLGQHREERIDAGLDRPLAEQLGAEAVNRVDVRVFERRQRPLESQLHIGRRNAGAIALERFAETQLQLAGSLFRECHCHDLSHRGPARGDDSQNAVHQLGRLAGARRCLDDQRVVEGVADRAAGIGVGMLFAPSVTSHNDSPQSPQRTTGAQKPSVIKGRGHATKARKWS